MIKRFLVAIVLLGLVVGGIVGVNLFRDRMVAGSSPTCSRRPSRSP
jgi:hypothetical protein